MASIVLLLLALSAPAGSKVEFSKDVAPILQWNCIRCHSNTGHINLSSRQAMIQAKALVPGSPNDSSLYSSIKNGTMPPGGKLSERDVAQIRTWIEQGAEWPTGLAFQPISESASTSPLSSFQAAEMQNVTKIRERVVEHEKQSRAVNTKPYKIIIANTTVSYDVVPISAGDFLMGSPEKKASDDEKPQHRVHVDAFSMQAHEVTWDEYRLFMFANQAGEVAHKDEVVDGVSRPTRPYIEMSFGMGLNGFPAISMTQHAANKYAEWLSSKTGEFYRIPTEAEWEYACRSGTSTPYYFGADASQLGEYAWFSGNSGGKYGKVATRKPNAWGLYDMLGNAMEWTLDGYEPYQPKAQSNPWVTATKPYPNSVRGGSWNDPADKVTCATRVASDASWKQQDPQLPKSIWYETDAQWLGFRLVRPAKLPSAEEMYRFWNSGHEHDEQ